ncbi:DUF6053 domain-containing protein [Lysobacter capsici]|uniref:DUF6053 domain-containing protein n=1 Tax=Lysobacter capsici TaxID=435897 RepID=UPI003D2F8876
MQAQRGFVVGGASAPAPFARFATKPQAIWNKSVGAEAPPTKTSHWRGACLPADRSIASDRVAFSVWWTGHANCGV